MALIVKSTRERVAKLFIGTVLCFGLAVWCWYDVTYKYVGEDYETGSKAGTRKFNQTAIPVLAVLGGLVLFYAAKAARLRYEADEETGISINGRQPIPWDAIQDIDTSALAKKGYLFVKYRTGPDQSAILKLDEYNLDFFDELYAMIRTKLGLPETAKDQGGGEQRLPETTKEQGAGEQKTHPVNISIGQGGQVNIGQQQVNVQKDREKDGEDSSACP